MSDDKLSKALYDTIVRIEEKCDRMTDRLAEVEKKQAVAEERQKIHVEHMEETSESIKEIQKILVGQSQDLSRHIRRSDLLQDQHDVFKEALQALVQRIQPLEEAKSVESIIKQYEEEKRKRLSETLKDWKTIVGIVIAVATFVGGKLLGWF